MDEAKSVAHKTGMNHIGQERCPDGLVPWGAASPPDLNAPYPESRTRTTGRLRNCSYCGSMHPADLAEAIRAGAKGHWADFKYGWPHKAYFDGVPNPHVGMLESRSGGSHATPLCPKTGEACTHTDKEGDTNQSWHRPQCECMKAGLPTEAICRGQRMVRYQTGFSQHTGLKEYSWQGAGEPAKATTYEKFYSVHLQDATPEDREVIEKHLHLKFNFVPGGRVSWQPWFAADNSPAKDAT